MKKVQYLVLLLLLSTPVLAQNLVDALRFSDYRLQGTARSTAMGNAFGALGGDFTSTSINPAGIGLYRSSEFVLTPTFGETNIKGSYLNNSFSDSKYNLDVPNLGYVANINSNTENGSSLVNVNIGLGYNRLNNYSLNKMVTGSGATSSMLDLFTLNSDGKSPSQLDAFYEQLAAYDQSNDFGTDLIYTDGDNLIYAHDMQVDPFTDNFTNFPHKQRKSFSQRGTIDEYVFNVALNFSHKFYVGATVGIDDVYFKENTSLYEYDVNYGSTEKSTYLNNYSFDTYLRTTGTGYNFKLGAIYKPIDELRLGVAFHSPTFYKMHDNYRNSMYSSIDYNDGGPLGEYSADSPIGNYDYELQSPMKTIFSLAYVAGKSGLISIDYELVDYSTAKLQDGGDNGYNFTVENQDIQSAYKSVGNIHVGGEYRVSDNLSLRGGYEYYPSPFNINAFNAYQPNSKADESAVSAGLGWRQNGFFFDVAYKHSYKTDYLSLYGVPSGVDEPLAKFDSKRNYATFTFGFRF